MSSSIVSYLNTFKQRVRLLCRSHPRALDISAVTSLSEPLFYPALVLILHQLFERLAGPQGTAQFSVSAAPIGAGIAILLLIQRLGNIVRDATSTILQQEAWIVINKQIIVDCSAIALKKTRIRILITRAKVMKQLLETGLGCQCIRIEDCFEQRQTFRA